MPADELQCWREQLRCGWSSRSREEVDTEQSQEYSGGRPVTIRVHAFAVLFGFEEVLEAVSVYLQGTVMPA